jgi:putative ABC transport system permease protein
MNRWASAFDIALASFRRTPLRAALSGLGVVVGVASLVAILALMDGLEAYARQQIEQTTDLHGITVRARTSQIRDGVRIPVDPFVLKESDVAWIAGVVAPLADLTPLMSAQLVARVAGDTSPRGAVVAAVFPSAAAVGQERILHGRYIDTTDIRADARVAVVPASIADWYSAPSSSLPGRAIRLDGEDFTIVGVVPAAAAAQRVRVALGATIWREMAARGRLPELVVRARRIEDVDSLRALIESTLAAISGNASAFEIALNQSRVAQAAQGLLLFKLVMGAIAGISLIVGGIGIMNILLASVYERTHEIGVRRAAGARAADIRRQFLAESLVLSGAGSAGGVAIGSAAAVVVAAGIRRFADIQVYAEFSGESVLLAMGVAVAVGLAFGTYPARRAGGLSPIDAIRHE